jgi:hypothetical protein
VRRVARDQPNVTRHTRPLLAGKVELHLPGDHPEDLLVRMLVHRGVGSRFHLPEHHHLLLAHENPARDLVADALLRQILESCVALHHGNGHGNHLLATSGCSSGLRVIATVAVDLPPVKSQPAKTLVITVHSTRVVDQSSARMG